MSMLEEISYDLKNPSGDRYTVKLIRDADKFLSEEMIDLLRENHLSMWGIYLFRDGYEQDVTSMKTLLDISSTLRDFLIANEGGMLYYICDDLTEVPMSNRHKDEGVRAEYYRDHLFSLLFEKSAQSTTETFCDTPIYIDACGNTIYIHVLARERHQRFVDLIKQNVNEGFSKPQ